MPAALVADDEPLLRQALIAQLARAWPELEVTAQARNGREALEQFEALRPDVCFLDVQMPGLSGVDVARQIGRSAHIVFVTAFDQYAVEAFAQGVLDYLVKPVEPLRLAETVARLKERLVQAQPSAVTDALLQRIAEHLRGAAAGPYLSWIRAQVGQKLRLIAVEDVDFLKSEAKYTLIACRAGSNQAGEALVRTPLKDLVAQLDPARFVQTHRAYAVNLGAISHVLRADNESGLIHLKGRKEVLPISRGHLHLFRQM